MEIVLYWVKYKTCVSDEEIALVLKCCEICTPNNQEYQNVISQLPTAKMFDHSKFMDSYCMTQITRLCISMLFIPIMVFMVFYSVMSKHLKEDHGIIDTYQQQIDFFAEVRAKNQV